MGTELTRALQVCSRFEHAAVGVAVCDTAGRFLSANRSFSRLTGYTLDELIHLDFVSITYPEDRPASAGMARRLNSGELSDYVREKRYVRPDGGIVWVRNSLCAIRSRTGTPEGAVCISEERNGLNSPDNRTDATEQREEALETNEQPGELHDRTVQLLATMSTKLSHIQTLKPGNSELRASLTEVVRLATQCTRDIGRILKTYKVLTNDEVHTMQVSLPLSPRERDVIQLLVVGHSNRKIADLLNISVRTVETHRARIMDKLGIRTVADLVLYAIRTGIVEC
ncbi:MAG: PAS domain S-box protein [Bryobacteraceae bacterium]